MKKIIASVVLTAATAVLAAGCTGSSKPSASTIQARQNGASAAISQRFNQAVPYPYLNSNPGDPLEMKNLSRRLQQYNSKGSTNYVYVFDFAGHVLGYYVINGKVSSTGSQMTSTQINVHCGYGGTNMACTNEAPGDDGSYGPNEGGGFGVFFFTTSGALVETDQPFLVSSQPIKIYSNVPQLDAPATVKR